MSEVINLKKKIFSHLPEHQTQMDNYLKLKQFTNFDDISLIPVEISSVQLKLEAVYVNFITSLVVDEVQKPNPRYINSSSDIILFDL